MKGNSSSIFPSCSDRASKLKSIKTSQNKRAASKLKSNRTSQNKIAPSKLSSIKTSQHKKSASQIKRRGRPASSNSRPNQASAMMSAKSIASVPPTKKKNSISSVIKNKNRMKTKKKNSKTQGKFKTQVDGWKSGNFIPKLFDFDGSESGLSSNVPQNSNYDQLFFFELFFDEKLIDMIVEQSNKYHDSIPVRCKDSNKRKHQKAWIDIDRKEMYVFLATFLLMSAVKKSKMQEYWSRDPLIETPMFRKIMPRDRFFAILRALHFNDNEKQVSGDRLFKMKPVMELLKERFSFYINAYKNLAIDESLMLWKGRLCFKQYISSKRHRFGVKLFILCDCETGAILDFIVYTGSNTEMTSFEDLGISGSR